MNRTQALSLSREAADTARDFLSQGTYANNDVTATQLMLAATLIDGLYGVIALVPSNGQGHTDTIVRSMYEALGDLYHLVADPSYLDRLRLVSAQKMQDNAEQFIQDRANDPTCADIVEVMKQHCRDAKKTIQQLQPTTRPLTIGERIQAPGLPSELYKFYGTLCLDAHHDLVSLHRRHLKEGEFVLGDTLADGEAFNSLFQALLMVAAALDVLGPIGKLSHAEREKIKAAILTRAESIINAAVSLTQPVRAKMAKSLAPKSASTD